MAREKNNQLKRLSELTGINYETLKLKFRGVTEFKLGEMLLVKRKVFNGETLDYLFATEKIQQIEMCRKEVKDGYQSN